MANKNDIEQNVEQNTESADTDKKMVKEEHIEPPKKQWTTIEKFTFGIFSFLIGSILFLPIESCYRSLTQRDVSTSDTDTIVDMPKEDKKTEEKSEDVCEDIEEVIIVVEEPPSQVTPAPITPPVPKEEEEIEKDVALDTPDCEPISEVEGIFTFPGSATGNRHRASELRRHALISAQDLARQALGEEIEFIGNSHFERTPVDDRGNITYSVTIQVRRR